MDRTDVVTAAFHAQASACRSLGSPFTAALCDRLIARLDRTSALGRRLFDWPGDPGVRADALALRACAAFARLADSDELPALAAFWRDPSPAAPDLDAVIAAALDGFDDRLAADLDRIPQTNEVARSAVLLGGALMLARQTGLPLELLEIGASAGLNLAFDHYLYDLGVGAWGHRDAATHLVCDWRGAIPPLDAPLEVVARAGCDLSPIDPGDPAARADLLAWVWADQPARRDRIAAALDLVADLRPGVDRADAADWLEARLAAPPEPGRVRTVIHTVVTQYLPAESRARIDAAIDAAGAEATLETPLARLAMEADDTAGSAAVTLTLWPGGEPREIGRADFHGRHVAWRTAAGKFARESH